MALQGEKQNEVQGQRDQQKEEKPEFGMGYAELPNSLMLAMPDEPPPGLPNSVMREMLAPQDPDLGENSDRFAYGSGMRLPNTVRRQMDGSAGAGFSNTENNDSIPRHELVHAGRRNAGHVRIGSSVPFGIVQRESVDPIPVGDLPDGLEIVTDNGVIRPEPLSAEEIRIRSESRTVSSTVRHRDEDGLEIHDSRKYGLEYVILGDGQYEVLSSGVWCRARAGETHNLPEDDSEIRESGRGTMVSGRSGESDVPDQDPAAANHSNPQDDVEDAALHPAPVPAALTKQDVQNAITALKTLIGTERRDLANDKINHQQELQNILTAQSPKIRRMAKSDNQLELMVFGQFENGLNNLESKLSKITSNVNKAKNPTDDELKQFRWEVRQKERELQGLQDLKTRKLAELTRQNGQPSKLEQELNAITQGVNRDTGRPDASEGLPDPKRVFDLQDDGTPNTRYRLARISKRPINIDGMVKYYRAWCKLNGRDLGESGRDNDPIQKGLEAAQAAAAHADPPVPPPAVGAPADGADHAGVPPVPDPPGRRRANSLPAILPNVAVPPAVLPLDDASRVASPPGGAPPSDGTASVIRREYNKPDPGLENSKWHTVNARLAQNIGGMIRSVGHLGVLSYNYDNHVTAKEKKDPNLKLWDKKKWDLTESHGNYKPYTKYVAPGIGLGLGIYGMGTSAMGMIHGMGDTARKFNNVKAGASHADWIQSGLDMIGSAGSFMSSTWSSWQSAGQLMNNFGWFNKASGFGKYLNTSSFGAAKDAIPGLSIATGSFSAATGTMEAIRGRLTRSGLHDAEKEMKRAGRDTPELANAPAIVPGVKTDQQKLKNIMKEGHQAAKFHMWSGGLKAAAGGLSAAAGISSLASAAPVAAGLQALAAITNIVKFAFDRGYSAHMRKSVVAKELDIDWDTEMDDVREMIHKYNPNFNMRDKYVREVILKAHGSGEAATRTAAYRQIKLKRAAYLINTAEQSGDPKASAEYQQTADMVISAMGVTKRGGRYANGAAAMLAEKLG